MMNYLMPLSENSTTKLCPEKLALSRHLIFPPEWPEDLHLTYRDVALWCHRVLIRNEANRSFVSSKKLCLE